jgi:hypothetical protein
MRYNLLLSKSEDTQGILKCYMEENRLRIKVKEMQTYHSKELDLLVKKVQEIEKRFGNK